MLSITECYGLSWTRDKHTSTGTSIARSQGLLTSTVRINTCTHKELGQTCGNLLRLYHSQEHVGKCMVTMLLFYRTSGAIYMHIALGIFQWI